MKALNEESLEVDSYTVVMTIFKSTPVQMSMNSASFVSISWHCVSPKSTQMTYPKASDRGGSQVTLSDPPLGLKI